MQRTRLTPFLIGSLAMHSTLLILAGTLPTPSGDGTTLAVTLFSSRAVPAANTGSSASWATTRPTGTLDARVRSESEATDPVVATGNPKPETPAYPEADRAGRQLTRTVLEALGPYFHYPIAARQRGWQGEVRIAVRIAADGKLGDIRLARSSGHALLDQAALLSFARIGRLTQAEEWLQGRSYDLQVPVVYRLTRG